MSKLFSVSCPKDPEKGITSVNRNVEDFRLFATIHKNGIILHNIGRREMELILQLCTVERIMK